MRFGAVLAGAILALPNVAIADDWHLHTHGRVRVQNDYTYKAPTKSEEINNTYTKSELEVELSYKHQFIVLSHFKIEPVRSPDGDSFFSDHGLWLDQLYAKYDSDVFEVFAGKFNPRFGFNDDERPLYMYGRDFMEDYEMTGAIGVGGAVKHKSEAWGEHALGGSVFFYDSTALSNTLITRPSFDDPRTERPKRLRRQDGGVGNTGSLESFTVALTGGKPAIAPGLEYRIGYRQQKKGETEIFDEKGFIAGLAYEFEIAKGLTFTPLIEYAYLDKFEGADATARYITGSAMLDWNPWSLHVSYTNRRLKFREDEPFTDNDQLFQVTLGYTFDFGLGLYLGWKTQRVAGERSESVGAMALYKIEF